MTSTITVLGASGLAGRAIVSHLAAATTRRLVLVGRDSERLQAVAASAQDAGALQPVVLVTGNKGWATVLNQAPHTELVLNLVGPATQQLRKFSIGALAIGCTTATWPTNWT